MWNIEDGMGKEVGGCSGWGTHVNPWLIHVNVWPASAGDTGDMGSILGSGRSPGVRNGSPFQYSCLGNSMTEDPVGLQFKGSQKSWTRLSD